MKKNCDECGHEFECYNNARKGRRGMSKRTSNSVTCSSKCSRLRTRRKIKEYGQKKREEHLKG